MKQAIVVTIAALVLVLVVGGSFFVLTAGPITGILPGSVPAPALLETARNEPVVARAKVVPLNSVALSFPSQGSGLDGLVSEVLVKEGDRVEKGALLARMDQRGLELRVEEAQAVLAQAKAHYDQLMAGASPQQVAAARAQLAQAQAKIRQAAGSVTPQDFTAAQAELTEARTALAQLQTGPKDTRVQMAQAAVDRARNRLQTDRDRLSAAKTDAHLQMERAANDLRDKQAEYSRIYWENQGQTNQLDQQRLDREAAALRAIQNAEKALDQARLAYEQARQAEVNGVAAAEAEMREAEAAQREVLAGADASLFAAARARLARAEANIASLQGDQHSGAVDAAAAEAEGAQAALEGITAKPRDVDLAGVVAQIQQAEVALKRSQLDLELAALHAPIAGTIVEVNLKVGEAPRATQPVIVLADFSAWQIITADLNEIDMMRIGEGNPVKITFDALPNFELSGKVVRVSEIGEESFQTQNVTYAAIITPDRHDSRLRWNLTAAVTITPNT
jgi:HlyD family secretion protein